MCPSAQLASAKADEGTLDNVVVVDLASCQLVSDNEEEPYHIMAFCLSALQLPVHVDIEG